MRLEMHAHDCEVSPCAVIKAKELVDGYKEAGYDGIVITNHFDNSFLVFFGIVVVMAFMGESEGNAADVSFGLVNVIKLFGIGVIAAATMVVPGVSGSMMLMILGYYNTILECINDTVSALADFNLSVLMQNVLILAPFGVGVVFGIFLIAKIIEFIFQRAETHAYWAIIGLIMASPIAILWKTDWSGFSLAAVLTGVVTFAIGWFIASKLGDE